MIIHNMAYDQSVPMDGTVTHIYVSYIQLACHLYRQHSAETKHDGCGHLQEKPTEIVLDCNGRRCSTTVTDVTITKTDVVEKTGTCVCTIP